MKKYILQFFLLAYHLTIRGEISSYRENEGDPWNFVLILPDDAGVPLAFMIRKQI